MEFVETSRFSSKRRKMLNFEEEQRMQSTLQKNPQEGSVEKSTGGFRKLRVGTDGRGKSGSVRVIYYFVTKQNQILLYDLYRKNEMGGLTDKYKKELKAVAATLK